MHFAQTNKPFDPTELKKLEFQYDLKSKAEIYLSELKNDNVLDNNEVKLLKMLTICRGKHVLPKFATHLGIASKGNIFEQKILNNLHSQLIEKLRDFLPTIE